VGSGNSESIVVRTKAAIEGGTRGMDKLREMAATRHVNPKISPVDRILPAPWGLSGGDWWLPLSHRVVGAPKPPSVTLLGKCPGDDILDLCPRRGGPAACARRGAEILPATPAPPRPVLQPPGAALFVRRVFLQAAPGTPGPARRKPSYCDPNLRIGTRGRAGRAVQTILGTNRTHKTLN
jgi:hypothetical protein